MESVESSSIKVEYDLFSQCYDIFENPEYMNIFQDLMLNSDTPQINRTATRKNIEIRERVSTESVQTDQESKECVKSFLK